MPECNITLSANAGISLSLGGIRIWIDALHNEKTTLFSTVDEKLWERMKAHEAFQEPDFIIFTHCHPDHYSYGMALEAKQLWPQATLLLPEKTFDGQMVLEEGKQFFWQGVRFRFFRLPHDGTGYEDVVNYGMLLSHGGFQVLVAGDAAIGCEALAEKLQGEKIDVAVLNFPWVTLRKGQRFIREVIQPESLVVVHLPFAEDDLEGFREATERAVSRFQEKEKIYILKEALQSVTIPY